MSRKTTRINNYIYFSQGGFKWMSLHRLTSKNNYLGGDFNPFEQYSCSNWIIFLKLEHEIIFETLKAYILEK